MLPDLIVLISAATLLGTLYKGVPKKIGSELDLNNVKAWIHPPVYLFRLVVV